MQKMFDDMMVAGRAKEMLTSTQLTLGELILKLEVVNQDLPIVFDEAGFKPTGLESWRGSYRELAIQYKDGGGSCYDQPKDSCEKDEFGDHGYNCPCGGSKGYETTLPKKPKVKDFLKILKMSSGKYFVGYKGGDFTMGKPTPIWVANYGTSSGFKSDEKNNKYSQVVVDIKELKAKVVIKTEAM